MSFSSQLKAEILENKPLRTRFKKAQAYGLFAFCKSFTESSVCISTENAETAKLFTWLLQDFLGRDTAIAASENTLKSTTLYTVKLARREDRKRILAFFAHTGGVQRENMPTPSHLYAFLSGAFLSCGNITDPHKAYHLEFVVRNAALAADLHTLLDTCVTGAKRTSRRGNDVLYYKEYTQIEDLLTLIGAHKACLAMIEVEMMKSMRNQANRATNCVAANIDKTVDAASGQIADITLVLKELGREALPKNLLQVADLRLAYPEASLRELAQLAEPAVSRSGMFHRLNRLSAMAAEIRQKNDH